MTKALRQVSLISDSSPTLDPQNWDAVRALGHRMLDDMIDYIACVRQRPVWQPIPDTVRSRFHEALPRGPSELGAVYREFADFIAPYATGNVHPGFMGWVHGGGSAVGMLAEMLAAGLNANLGGRDHVPIEVERQVVEWTREMFGFPRGATGIFVTGTSMANLMAVLVARRSALGPAVRQRGVGEEGGLLTAYTSKAAHGCITKAMDIAGLGSEALRCVGIDHAHRIDVAALRTQIAEDRKAGLKPFLVVASAGTV
ncbi:MAG: pyridoxal phosphate-dependent decarboxylase family protein, partial [Bradyrhizobium sp.]